MCVPQLTHNLVSIYQITHGGNGRIVELTPNLVIIRDLESREFIATGVVDHSSQLYYFANFSTDSASIPRVVHHTTSLHHHSEGRLGFLNLVVLDSDLILEPSISSPPPTIAVVDTSMATCGYFSFSAARHS